VSHVRVYSIAEVEALHRSIPYGCKKSIAWELGIKPSALSRYINAKANGCRMPERIYNKIIEFINKTSQQNGTENRNN
jgi:predicted transcriptional regulator